MAGLSSDVCESCDWVEVCFFRGFLDSCFSQVLIEGMMGEKEGSEVGDTRSAVRIGLASGRWRREE